MFLSVDGKCPESRCTFTTEKSLENQNKADAVLFHMPNFHWDRYLNDLPVSEPELILYLPPSYSVPEIRRPDQNWIFMSYETATNVRMR